jgi:hypothetical protein
MLDTVPNGNIVSFDKIEIAFVMFFEVINLKKV